MKVNMVFLIGCRKGEAESKRGSTIRAESGIAAYRQYIHQTWFGVVGLPSH